jgi:transposase-like protein
MKEIKVIHKALTDEAAIQNLDQLEENWGNKYSLVVRSCRNIWDNLATFFEALHRQFRKVTESESLFLTDDALKKMLFLYYRDL